MAARRLSPAFLVLTLTIAAGAAPSATDQEYSKRVWQSDDGLPQNRIQALSQTSDGYLWIGTSGGLVRFDGIRFVVFDRSTTPALGDDSILTLCSSRDGGLWIGTEGGGLAYMKAGVFRSFGATQGLTNPFVRAIKEGRGGELWVATDRGIFRRDSAQNGHFIRLDGPTGAGKGVPILAGSSILQDGAGTIWVGTTSRLYRLTGDQLTADESFRTQGAIRSLLEDPDGTLWASSGAGLWRIRNGRAEPPRLADPKNPRILCRDHDGNLWVSSAGTGLVRLSRNGASVAFRGETLPDTSVLALFEDREQNLWVGTLDGLLRLTKSAVRTVSAADGLAEDNVVSVSDDPAGRLWIGTANGQLYNLAESPKGQIVTPFHPPATVANFRARSIFTDREGNQWFASTGQGFLRIAAGKPQVFTVRDGLRSNNTRYFLEDRKGDVWIATGSGLSRWSANAPLRTYYLEDGLSYGSVFMLAEDRNGDILVGTEGGINRVHEGVFVADAVFAQLGNERIRAIHVDPAGSLWLGTRGNGVVRIRNGKVARFTTREGLLSNSIHQILADGDRFWMSSPAGVFAAERRDLDALADGRPGPIAVIPYGTDSGMRSSQMNGGTQSAGCRTRDGVFWFSSVKGAVRIDPRQLRPPVASPVLIESVLADDNPIPLGKDIKIPPGRGKLEIGYTAPDLLSPDRVTFRYRLEGFDENWTPSPRGRAAYYTNLPAGHYRFHVVARDAARPEMTSEAVLPFVWQAHFYESAWFFALLAVLTGLAVWSIFGWYARQTRARYALVLAERTRLAREMHDTVIQGCVGVSTLLEAARSMPASAKDKAAELVERAAVQVRVTVNEARDAVWDLRHSAIGHEDGQPTDLVQTLESFARQVESSEGIAVRTEFNGPPSSLGNAADRNLLLVAREAIRNAVTHAHAACIQLKVRFDPGEVRLEVSDDGKGFNPAMSRENGHYGIIGMRERVEQSGGVFQMISSPGHGTSVRAVLRGKNPPAARKKT